MTVWCLCEQNHFLNISGQRSVYPDTAVLLSDTSACTQGNIVSVQCSQASDDGVLRIKAICFTQFDYITAGISKAAFIWATQRKLHTD